MSRDYKNVKKKNKEPNPVIGNLLSFLTGLSLGLFIAFLIYLRYANQAAPGGAETTAMSQAGQKTTNRDSPAANEKEKVPAPTFDFYKILPNKEINISEWVAEEKQGQNRTETRDNGIYVLQVGSFKDYKAADQTKASLALIGISAEIQRVVINGQDIHYRVRVGPYNDRDKLIAARKRLEDNNLSFMVLKLKAEDVQQ